MNRSCSILFSSEFHVGYRYSFNGKETETAVNTGAYDFGARIFDSRIGKWLSVDLLADKYPAASTYCFAHNSPIQAFDPDGMRVYYVSKDGIITRLKRSTLRRMQNFEIAGGFELMNHTKMGRREFNFFNSSKDRNVFIMLVDGHLMEVDEPRWPGGCAVAAGKTIVADHFSNYSFFTTFEEYDHAVSSTDLINARGKSVSYKSLDVSVLINKNTDSDWDTAFTLWHELNHGINRDGTNFKIDEDDAHARMGLDYSQGAEKIIRGGEADRFLKELTHSIYRELNRAKRRGDDARTKYLSEQFHSICKFRNDKSNFIDSNERK
jgi:RHS repeat-associated protein